MLKKTVNVKLDLNIDSDNVAVIEEPFYALRAVMQGAHGWLKSAEDKFEASGKFVFEETTPVRDLNGNTIGKLSLSIQREEGMTDTE